MTIHHICELVKTGKKFLILMETAERKKQKIKCIKLSAGKGSDALSVLHPH